VHAIREDAHLHGYLAVVDEHLAREKVGADRGLVAGAELFVDLSGQLAWWPWW
jgi:hypothetical protein